MREGTVVYLAGAIELPDTVDVEGELARAGLDPAWTEIAGQGSGYRTIQRAALELAQRGAGRITFAPASAAKDGIALGSARHRLVG